MKEITTLRTIKNNKVIEDVKVTYQGIRYGHYQYYRQTCLMLILTSLGEPISYHNIVNRVNYSIL